MYGAIGTGNIEPGIVTISLGTSGTIYTVLEEPFVDPSGEIASFCDSTGKYMPLLCVSNMANGYNQILKQFQLTHQSFEKLLKETPPANKGRLLFPWFIGERTPDLPHAVPVFWGFQLGDFSPSVLARSVLEGHVLNLYDGFQRMPVRPREIRLTGGLSKSDAWCQTISDIFGTETVPLEGEGAAMGAAIHAAWVYHKKSDPAINLGFLVDKFISFIERRRKYPENAATYSEIKKVYSEIRSRLINNQNTIDVFKISENLRNLN
jgi:xylulokinase